MTLLVLAAASLLPGAQAALNKSRPFSADFAYMQGLDAEGNMTVVSGALDATLSGAPGSFGLFDSDAYTIRGLDKVCWNGGCNQSASNALSLAVSDGGSFALCFPTNPAARLEAAHALALFVGLASDDDLNTFAVADSLVTPMVDGMLAFSTVAPIPASGLDQASLLNAPCDSSAGLSALDETTQVTLRDGASTVVALAGKQARLLFTGQPVLPSVSAAFVVAPFGAGSEAHFHSATDDAAAQGLDIERVQELINLMDASHARSTVDRTQAPQASQTPAFMVDLLNGALLGLPGGTGDGSEFPIDGLHFIRFTTLDVEGAGDALSWQGRATLEIEDGHVLGAKPLVGAGPLQLPWWSLLLWAIGITLFIVRLSLKPDKTHPRWDRFKWVGWVASALAWILIFFLWDAEVAAVLGTSFLHSSGQTRLVLLLAQVVLLSIIGFIAIAPLRLLLRNTSLLAHQGTFMGLAGAVAALIGFLLAATYLRAYLDLILSRVMEQLA